MLAKEEPSAIIEAGRKRIDNFARRLEEACEAHPRCPTEGRGKQKWLREELHKRFGITVSAEAVSKWFSSRSFPRPHFMDPLAQCLNVTEAWLISGVPPMHRTRGQAVGAEPAVNAPQMMRAPILPAGTTSTAAAPGSLFSGAVDLLAAMVQMSGGTVAFPGSRGSGMMLAVLNNKMHAIQIILANEVSKGHYSFAVPSVSNVSVRIAVVPGDHPFDTRFILVDDALVAGANGGEVLIEKGFRGFSSPHGEVTEIANLSEL